MEKCVNCQYYDRRNARPNDGRSSVMWGNCRRHSPHLSPTGAQKTYLVEGVWPLIRDDDWCGEWRAPARSAAAHVRFAPSAVETKGAAPTALPASTQGAIPQATGAD